MNNHLFRNTDNLIRFIFRRDRVRLPIWVISLASITVVVANAFTGLYGNKAERQGIAETMKNPAMTAMVGPGFGLDNYTIGAMMAHQMLLFTAITVGIMSILLVTRHTRTDEEEGRIELIRSLPTGRLANLTATLFVVSFVNIILALVTGIGLYALNIESMDLEGSLLYGAALGATGIFFTALTAVFAQIAENSRGTIGLSISILLLTYFIRAIGDVSNETLSWFSPLGWILQSKVYVDNSWWPIGLTIFVSIFLIILAFYLHVIRDLEAGFLPSRPGKKHASRLLQSPLGLSVRLGRTTFISWAIGLFILGASYGSVFGDLEAFFSDNEMIQQLLAPVEGVSLTEQFITLLMTIMAIISSIPALMVMLKPIGEERKNRTEHLLSRAVSRTKVLGSSLFLAVLTSLIMQSLTAVGLWAAAIGVMDDPISFATVYQAAIVYVPAIWIMIGVTVLLIGFLPRLTSLIWVYLFFSFIVVYLGGLLEFPDWLKGLSPYGHIPESPVEELNVITLSILFIIACVITIAGFFGYRQRDIHG